MARSATFSRTVDLDTDVVGHMIVVVALENHRDGVSPVVDSSVLTFFSVGDIGKSWEFALLDYDCVLERREQTEFTSAVNIRRLNDITSREMYDEVHAFMEANTDLVRGTDAYKQAFWLRVFTIERAGSVLKGNVAMLMAGCACCVPVRVKIGDKYGNYQAILSRGWRRKE